MQLTKISNKMRDQLQNNYPGEIFAEKRKPRKFYLLLVDIKDV